MNVAFRRSFERDLKRIKDKQIIARIEKAALLLGPIFTWLQFSVARDEAAQDQTARTEELALARGSTIADRFARAVEQLADQRTTLQLGGVYTLEELAREDEDYRLFVTGVLSSHVRSVLKKPPHGMARTGEDRRADVRQAAMEALRILSSLNPWETPVGLPYVEAYDIEVGSGLIERTRLDLEEIDLSYQNISGLDLRGAVLENADLQVANMTGVDLTGSMLFGADLTSATARKALLRGADLRLAVLGDRLYRSRSVVCSLWWALGPRF